MANNLNWMNNQQRNMQKQQNNQQNFGSNAQQQRQKQQGQNAFEGGFGQWRGNNQPQQVANYGGMMQSAGGVNPFNTNSFLGDSGYGIGVPSGNTQPAYNGGMPQVPQLPTTNWNDWGDSGGAKATPSDNPLAGMGGRFTDFNQWMNDQSRPAMKSFLENYGFPKLQFNSNEQAKRYDQYMRGMNFNMQSGMNEFNMGQQNWQNDFNQQLADTSNQQFNDQFSLDSRVAEQRYGKEGTEWGRIGADRFRTQQETARANAANMNQRTLQGMMGQQAMEQIGGRGEQDRRLQQMIGGQEMSQLQKSLANQLMQSRYQAFGRAQAPNARFAANWG